MFFVKNDDKVFEVSEKKVDSILITTSATITTDAIKFAVENNIDIVFLDNFGDPYGQGLALKTREHNVYKEKAA